MGSSVVLVGLAAAVGAAAPELDGEREGEGEGEGEGDEDRDEDEDGEGDGDAVRECVGDGDGEGDVEGDGERPAGSSLQVLSAFADELELVPGAAGLSETARAMVGQIASTPTISKTPVSKLSVVARTCAKRI